MGLLIWLLFGAVVGWVAGAIMNDAKNPIVNIIVGIVGSYLGSWLAQMFLDKNISEFSVEGAIFAVIGACLLIFLKRLFTGKGF